MNAPATSRAMVREISTSISLFMRVTELHYSSEVRKSSVLSVMGRLLVFVHMVLHIRYYLNKPSIPNFSKDVGAIGQSEVTVVKSTISRFLLYACSMDFWAPFFDTANDNMTNMFCMQFSSPSFLSSSLSTERENMRGWEGGENQRALKTNFMNSNQASNTFFADNIQTWRKTDYICYLSGRASAAQGRT